MILVPRMHSNKLVHIGGRHPAQFTRHSAAQPDFERTVGKNTENPGFFFGALRARHSQLSSRIY